MMLQNRLQNTDDVLQKPHQGHITPKAPCCLLRLRRLDQTRWRPFLPGHACMSCGRCRAGSSGEPLPVRAATPNLSSQRMLQGQ